MRSALTFNKTLENNAAGGAQSRNINPLNYDSKSRDVISLINNQIPAERDLQIGLTAHNL